jgi:hypothetical protein
MSDDLITQENGGNVKSRAPRSCVTFSRTDMLHRAAKDVFIYINTIIFVFVSDFKLVQKKSVQTFEVYTLLIYHRIAGRSQNKTF